MNIKIEHISNTYNYGSLMMAITTLNKLNENMKDVKFYVDTTTDNDLERLKIETKCKNIFKATYYQQNKIKKLLLEINDDKNLYDAKIILGGDDISEYYGKKYWIKKFPIMYYKASKVKTILVGQTVGPFTGYRRGLARLTLNKMKIYTRDDECLEYLEGLGVKSAVKGRDLAFLSLPNNGSEILKKYELQYEKYITIVPSGLYKWYTSDYNKYISEQINIIENVIKNDRLSEYKIVLLSHVLLPENVDDRKIIKSILDKIDSKLIDRLIPITDELLASEARVILGNGLFTITGRMHAAVSTFFMRKPALSLSYSVKYSGVIGSGLNRRDLIIESKEELWNYYNISKLVDEKINYILDNYSKLMDEIESAVSETSKIVDSELEDLVKLLNEK